ncbi:MAG: hypothetical protein JW944_02325 [Deltaproteobacteria bacterium]|nr:hypothetical protein [Deltaproteobacteria bacterium]
MNRLSINTGFILLLIFLGVGAFDALVPLKAFAVQASDNPSDPTAPPVLQSNDNDGLNGNDLRKYRSPRSGDLVSVGQDRIIGKDEVIENNAVVIGADLTVYGRVDGDAVCIGGDLTVGPDAIINGDIVNVGGTLAVDPSARTFKDRVNVRDPFGFLKDMTAVDIHKLGGKINYITKILRIVMDCVYFILLLFLALLLTTFIPRQFKNVEDKLRNEFPKCVLLGIASMVGFPIIILAFLITIVGIPVIPFLLLAIILFTLTGYIVFSRMLGGRLLPEKAIMLQILAGLLLLHSPLLIGDLLLLPGGMILSATGHLFRVVGIILVLSLNFIGLGAVVYALLARKKPIEPNAVQPDSLPGSSGNGNEA